MLILRTVLICVFCVVVCSGAALASGITTLLSFPGEALYPGKDIFIDAYFHNETGSTSEVEIPYQLQLVIDRPDQIKVQISAFSLKEDVETITLPPGGFYKQQYTLSIPRELLGTFQYSVAGYPAIRGLIAVTPEPRKEEVAARTAPPAGPAAEKTALDSLEELEQDTTEDRYPTLTNLEPLYQSYVANFSTHEPIYFLVGSDPEKSKFQLSFKYRLFNPSGTLSQKYDWLSGIHLAYTQTSYWDLASDSAPFEDTSYKPEILYQSQNLDKRPSWLDGLFLQTGMRHESNGRAGDESRSTNTFYFRPIAIFFDQESQLGFALSPKVYGYFNNSDDTNRDFARYRGYFELEAGLGKAHSLMFTSNLRFAAEGTSFELNATYPIHRFLYNNLDLYLQLQYTNSLAENLIDYQERNEAFRIGLSLVR